jgi:hypothetical protein
MTLAASSDEAWAIYRDLAGKYETFIDSEKGREARRKELEKLEQEGPEDLAGLAVWLINMTSDWAAAHSLRAVAAYLAEHPER